MSLYAALGKGAELGVAAVSKQLHEGVTTYHAQIGANVPNSELVKLEQKLTKEGSKACFAQEFEEALNMFTHALAVAEKTKSNVDPGTRGTYVHNIGFCLHCLGEFEAAKAYYEQSIELLNKVQVPLSTRFVNGVLYPERLVFEFIYGGLNHNRIQMTRERILDCQFGRRPDLKILDEYGRTKPMPGAKEQQIDTSVGLAATWEERDGAAPEWSGDRRGEDATASGSADPSWLAATQAQVQQVQEEEAAPSGSGRDDTEQEAARKEWLQYHMQVGEWAEAQELVVTKEERDDLNYLRQRALREGAP